MAPRYDPYASKEGNTAAPTLIDEIYLTHTNWTLPPPLNFHQPHIPFAHGAWHALKRQVHLLFGQPHHKRPHKSLPT